LSILIDLEAILEALRNEINTLKRTVKLFEKNNNMVAADDTRTWIIQLEKLYIIVKNLVDILNEDKILQAETIACSLREKAYRLYSLGREPSYSFIASRSLTIIASLLNVTGTLCSKGMSELSRPLLSR